MLNPEIICPTVPFQNGSNPTWCHGNSMVCRVGDRVFATIAHVNEDRLPYNRTHMELWEKKDGADWKIVYADEGVYQREPCYPLYLGNNRLAVVANPTAQSYKKDEPSTFVDCVPTVYLFDISDEVKKTDTIRLTWDDPGYRFIDHSYRSGAVDMENGNILFTNMYMDGGEGSHCYTLVDRDFQIIRMGKLPFQKRACYQNIAMRGNETYAFGVQDIVEPVEEWKKYKYEKTGSKWDYDSRRILLCYSPDIEKEDFRPSVTVCHRDDTCGLASNLDCCFDSNGDMLFLVSCRSIWHAFMRDRFFPDTPLECTLEVYRFSKGELKEKRLIEYISEENGAEIEHGGFFHTASNGDIYVIWSRKNHGIPSAVQEATYLSRIDAPDEAPLKLMDRGMPIFGNKTRLGAPIGNTVDMYWYENSERVMYARYDLK